MSYIFLPLFYHSSSEVRGNDFVLFVAMDAFVNHRRKISLYSIWLNYLRTILEAMVVHSDT